jgi:hypothetical protein
VPAASLSFSMSMPGFYPHGTSAPTTIDGESSNTDASSASFVPTTPPTSTLTSVIGPIESQDTASPSQRGTTVPPVVHVDGSTSSSE